MPGSRVGRVSRGNSAAIAGCFALTLVTCCRDAGQEGRASSPKTSIAHVAATAARSDSAPASAPSSAELRQHAALLAIDSLPPRAIAALRAFAPDFQPWAPSAYDSTIRANYVLSPDAGLSIVRAHFQAPTLVDYAVIGYDRKLHARRVVALMASADGGFVGKDVTAGPAAPDSLAEVANTVLVTGPWSDASRDELAVETRSPSGPIESMSEWVWDAKYRWFRKVEPD